MAQATQTGVLPYPPDDFMERQIVAALDYLGLGWPQYREEKGRVIAQHLRANWQQAQPALPTLDELLDVIEGLMRKDVGAQQSAREILKKMGRE